MGKVERMGSGIRKMKNLMKKAGSKPPVFEADTFFRATFYRNPEYSLKKIPAKVGEKGVENLSRQERLLCGLIRNDRNISKKEMMLRGKLTKKSVEYNLGKLKARDILKRVGPDKGGHWEILEKK
ncbi:MAG: hypothetical protein A2351_00270 [Omnitrophica bacterium RIFOXYB12_FULL_50_7]|nr:MAG: hypothetical protein A2351_00270 [Omnitrophica bacterium RIFOXYB12_FULL_50_7]